jgi:ribose transport system substrate-binding protein
MPGRPRAWLLAVVVAIITAACGNGESPDADPAAGGEEESFTVAFFAASSQNAFNQAVYEGVELAADRIGVDTEIFDGEFNAEVQLRQMEDAIASGRFDGFVLLANDTVGIGAAVEQADAAGIPTVTTLFPIGPDLTTLEPQVEGIVGTVARPPGDGARLQAEAVAEFCADKDPCNVVILIGQLQFPFDNVRYEAFQEVLGQHDNINVVATGEGNYDRDTSLTAMQDILQANPDIHAVLSNADQHVLGAEVAIEDAGYDLEELYLIGAGAAVDAVEAVRSGRWDATLADYPRTMGERALEILIQELRGEDHEVVVNEDEFYPFGPILTTEVLEENPDFTGEFQG